jgi:hypothetical protein
MNQKEGFMELRNIFSVYPIPRQRINNRYIVSSMRYKPRSLVESNCAEYTISTTQYIE